MTTSHAPSQEIRRHHTTSLRTVRLRRLASVVTTKAHEKTFELGLEDVESWTGRLVKSETTYEAAGVAFEKDDILFGKLRPYLAKVYQAEQPGQAVGDFIVIRPNQKVHPRFLTYNLLAPHLVDTVSASAYGSKMPRTNWEDLSSQPIVLPPFEEQCRIVAFLDYETTRIDELVHEQERLAGLLLERRSASVIAAVSGQLSNTEMVGSRIPWLPKIASGWQEVQIRRVAKLGTGHTPSRSRPDYWENCTIPWVTTGEVAQLREDRIEYLYDTREMISEVGLANSSAVLHPAGTVFLSRTASAGFSGIMGLPMATSQDYVAWTCGDSLNPRFLLLCLRAMRSDLLGRLAMGSTHKTIYMPEIEQLMIPLPPIDEQAYLVEHTWNELSQIDSALDQLSERSELLLERRSALISAAVTGQLDLREWRPPESRAVAGVV